MTSRDEAVTILRPHGREAARRAVAIEAPVAIEVDGLGYAVMMMTPADLPQFATGFLLTERLIDAPADLADLDVIEGQAGWILRATLAQWCAGRVLDRVRHRTSDTSCGLCGIESLEQLRRPVASAPRPPELTSGALFAALGRLRAHQPLNGATGAVHAAVACDARGAILRAFEDVGRHNALDKLIGALAREAITPAFLLVTSRVSFEMVDKALVARAPMLVGVSAPTSLAVDHARAHHLTLVALARAHAVLVLHPPAGIFKGED